MADYAPAVKKLLKEDGCWLDRQGKGDHEIWCSLAQIANSPSITRSSLDTPPTAS
jgi:hypothetical protein